MLENTGAGLAQHAEAMRLIDHEPGRMPPLDLDEALQIREIAIHAVEAFVDDQHAFVAMAHRGEKVVERIEIVVWEEAPLGVRQLAAHDDTIMCEGIVDDEVLRTEQ